MSSAGRLTRCPRLQSIPIQMSSNDPKKPMITPVPPKRWNGRAV